MPIVLVLISLIQLCTRTPTFNQNLYIIYIWSGIGGRQLECFQIAEMDVGMILFQHSLFIHVASLMCGRLPYANPAQPSGK